MIHLTTGQPGAGKTLWTLAYVKQLAEREGRQVYYSGINDLKLPWTELEKPEEWHTLPAKSIIVIDEAQRLFRPRGNGTTVPEYVAALETHRHRGHDLFVITQHPMLVETNVRRLVGKHWHVMRTFGMHRATVHEFTELKQEPDKSREGSIRHEWKYPEEVFTYYKSAEVHTHKRSIPMRVWFLLAVPLVLGTLGYMAYSQLTPEAVSASTVGQVVQAESIAPAGRPATPEPMTTKEYVAQFQPRIESMPWTAPRYDQLTQPKVAPVMAGCIAAASKCKCYSRQGTAIDTDETMCRNVARNGYFDDTREPLQNNTAIAPARGSAQTDVAVPAGAMPPTGMERSVVPLANGFREV